MNISKATKNGGGNWIAILGRPQTGKQKDSESMHEAERIPYLHYYRDVGEKYKI